jgi:hypothetical protein
MWLSLSQNKKCIYVSYTISTVAGRSFYTIFLVYLCFHYNLSHEIKCESFHLWCERLADFRAFWIYNFQMRDAEPTTAVSSVVSDEEAHN